MRFIDIFKKWRRIPGKIKQIIRRVYEAVWQKIFGLSIFADHYYFKNRLSPNALIVDMGAGHGDFAGHFLDNQLCGEIILIEGNPHLTKETQTKFAGRNARSINACVKGKDQAGNTDFYLRKIDEISSGDKDFPNSTIPPMEVVSIPVLTLKKLYQTLLVEQKIDLLKIDIEGGEWELLENFDKEDYEKINAITVEFHCFMDAEKRDRTTACVAHLRSLGYRLRRQHWSIYSPYYNCLFYKNPSNGKK